MSAWLEAMLQHSLEGVMSMVSSLQYITGVKLLLLIDHYSKPPMKEQSHEAFRRDSFCPSKSSALPKSEDPGPGVYYCTC